MNLRDALNELQDYLEAVNDDDLPREALARAIALIEVELGEAPPPGPPETDVEVVAYLSAPGFIIGRRGGDPLFLRNITPPPCRTAVWSARRVEARTFATPADLPLVIPPGGPFGELRREAVTGRLAIAVDHVDYVDVWGVVAVRAYKKPTAAPWRGYGGAK